MSAGPSHRRLDRAAALVPRSSPFAVRSSAFVHDTPRDVNSAASRAVADDGPSRGAARGPTTTRPTDVTP
jgi:hypothetical protein